MNETDRNSVDHEHFAKLFVRNQVVVYRYIVTLVPNQTDAEDLFQETNLTLWKKWDSYDRDRPFLPWACGIALNHIRNFWRKRHDVAVVFDDDLLQKLSQLRLQDDEILRERQDALTTCLEKLPRHCRDVVRSYYIQADSINTIAQRVSKNNPAIYKMIERIRRFLYECINRKVRREA